MFFSDFSKCMYFSDFSNFGTAFFCDNFIRSFRKVEYDLSYHLTSRRVNFETAKFWKKEHTLNHATIIVYLVTLTFKFDLLLKNFKIGHNFYTIRC